MFYFGGHNICELQNSFTAHLAHTVLLLSPRFGAAVTRKGPCHVHQHALHSMPFLGGPYLRLKANY